MFVRDDNSAHWLAVFQCICFVGALLTACNQSAPPRPPEPTRAESAETVPSPPVQEVKERSYSTVESIPYDSGDINVISVERKEENQRFVYDLDISYPQIDKPRTSNQHKFNGYVRRAIESEVRAFKNYCVKNSRKRDGTKREMQYHLGIDYEVLFATPEVLSIDLTIESFTGYLNSDWFSLPFNYDLKTGRPLVLADMFKRRSKFLKVLATYCADEFMKRGLNCGGGGVSDEQWMQKGAKPTKDNYASWNLTRNGIQVTFGEYQVGPGCLGLVKVVVPYKQLQQILRRNAGYLLKH
jgi:Deacetylase PdaC/Protein of unknown function (DUF3298)